MPPVGIYRRGAGRGQESTRAFPGLVEFVLPLFSPATSLFTFLVLPQKGLDPFEIGTGAVVSAGGTVDEVGGDGLDAVLHGHPLTGIQVGEFLGGLEQDDAICGLVRPDGCEAVLHQNAAFWFLLSSGWHGGAGVGFELLFQFAQSRLGAGVLFAGNQQDENGQSEVGDPLIHGENAMVSYRPSTDLGKHQRLLRLGSATSSKYFLHLM